MNSTYHAQTPPLGKSERETRMKIRTRYFAIIGILLFVYILSRADIGKVTSTLSKANPYYIAISVALAGFAIILRSLKWGCILKSHGINIPMARTIKIWLIGSFVGSITPGRAGEIIKVYYLKDKYQSGLVLSTIAIDRISDIIGLFILSIISIALLSTFFNINMFSIMLLIIITTVLGYLFTKEKIVRKIAKPVYSRFAPESQKKKLKISYENFFFGFTKFKKNKMVVTYTLGMTLTTWLIGITQAYMLTQALGLRVSYLYLVSIIPLFMLTAILPITVAGVGTREAAFIFFFSLVGVSASDAISYSLLELAVLLLSMLAGAIIWLSEKKKVSI